ncbi:MAG TPA: potassium transporter Trk [Acidimicrobiales bacterium]|nr:potassium transporter Trk [Acidimicrobiales bacterium]
MADVVFVLVAVAFFGLCVLYVKGCERILRGAGDADETTEGVTR